MTKCQYETQAGDSPSIKGMKAEMKSRLLGPVLLLLLFLRAPASGLGSVLVKSFTYIQSYYTWQEAQTFCRRYEPHLPDRLTEEQQSDADALYLQSYYAWIDGQQTPNFYWSWYYGNQVSPWGGNKPSSGDACVYVSSNDKRFYVADCEKYYFFICYTMEQGEIQYTFINQTKTWSDAQQHCSTMNQDLAVISNYDQLYSASSEHDFPVWTGLYRDGATWSWSAGLSDYRNWALNQPGNNGDCVAISSVSKTMTTQNCSARYPFVCFVDNLLLVKENRTWEEALEYCKELNAQLVSVQPGDYTYISDRAMEADTDELSGLLSSGVDGPSVPGW
ncbi:macrophage mannose receptor 1-like isoform X2 [Betta splendens]|uniref:Macrophage mannose receptor 1-like isoform X2 n=1 Tax=Betta splendens TaxID=158456 RepID=A0A9W2XP48_BETSP|nr:macrophage mannose receptor 1-like isoform X2 [Betta splendens]